ncbi:MAG: L-erythro-3,5-diaminohexanoate dehydrogenase [Actinomycetota bacterium]
MDHSSPFGLHRVLTPPGVLPQRAERLDPSPPARGGEALIEVERLNLDAASYHQIREEQGGDPDRMRARVLGIVRERGKLHNPVTGSGGMLIGTVREVGEGRADLRPGDRIATLVSLTLTPLAIDDLSGWDGTSEQAPAEGHAILFETSPFARLPEDLSDGLALALFDVAGAPAQVARLAPGRRATLVLGAAGKSGLLSMVAARGRSERVLGLVPDAAGVETLRRLGFDEVVMADATDPIGSVRAASEAFGGGEDGVADLVVNCVNVPGTEAASILLAREGGTVYFFSMATSFSAAALTAEGLGKDVTMVIGSGYAPGHAESALGLVREHPDLYAVLEGRFGT